MPRGQKGTGLGQRFMGRTTARAAARLGHNTIGTAMDAAILDLEHSPRAAEGADAKRWVSSGEPPFANIGPWTVQKARLCLVAQTEIRLRPHGAGARTKRSEKPRRAAGQDDAGLRRRPSDAKNGIAGVPFRPRGDGATVDQNDIRRFRQRDGGAPTRLPRLADRLAFILVDLAAERHDVECPGSHAPLCMQKPPP